MKCYLVILFLFFFKPIAFTQALQDTAFISNTTEYHIRLTANCDYDIPVLFEGKEKVKQRTDSLLLNTNFIMEGTALVSKVFNERKLTLLRFQFTPDKLVFSNQGITDSNSKAAILYLSKPVFIRPGAALTGARLFYQQGIPSGYKQLINQLISYMHISDSFPVQCPPGGCVVEEEDRIGVLESNYQVIDGHTGNGSKKYKRTGLGYASFSNNNLTDYKQNLEAFITVRNETIFNIELKEVLTLLVQGKTTSITNSNFHLQQTGWAPLVISEKESLMENFQENLSALVKVTLSEYISKDEISLSVYQRILGDDNYASIIAKINSLRQSGAKIDSAKDYKKVAALIYLNPGMAIDFAKQIVGKAATDIHFKIIVKGLTDAATIAAQKQLAFVFHARSNDPQAIDFLINNLLFLDNPSPEIIDSIKAIALNPGSFDSNISIAMRYFLGSLCHRLKVDNAGRANDILLNIIAETNKYARVGSKEKNIQLLGIIGNAGLDSSFKIIESYLNDADTDIKIKALAALRFIDHKSIESILLNVLDSSFNNELKNTVLSVLQYKPFTATVNDHVVAALKKTTDDILGVNLIRFLKLNEGQCSGCYQLFKEIATQHSSKKVRAEAEELLKRDNKEN